MNKKKKLKEKWKEKTMIKERNEKERKKYFRKKERKKERTNKNFSEMKIREKGISKINKETKQESYKNFLKRKKEI